jgi:outer membrane lipoprotein-sorting protein
MNFGRRVILCRFRCSVVATLLLAVVLIAGAPVILAAGEWDLRALMTAMSKIRSSTASFTETRYLHLLKQAQTSTGRLTYVAPDHLQKDTVAPVLSRMTIDGDHLTIELQGEPKREFSLRDYSGIGKLIDGLRATLAGDVATLTRNFTVRLDGDANQWALLLTPIDPNLRQLVTTIRITGEQTAITDIETVEADGDRIDMTISHEQK